jgi:hypothetical protein
VAHARSWRPLAQTQRSQQMQFLFSIAMLLLLLDLQLTLVAAAAALVARTMSTPKTLEGNCSCSSRQCFEPQAAVSSQQHCKLLWQKSPLPIL